MPDMQIENTKAWIPSFDQILRCGDGWRRPALTSYKLVMETEEEGRGIPREHLDRM